MRNREHILYIIIRYRRTTITQPTGSAGGILNELYAQEFECQAYMYVLMISKYTTR